MRLYVTVCNTHLLPPERRRPPFVLAIDPATRQITEFPLDAARNLRLGAGLTGLARTEDGFVALAQFNTLLFLSSYMTIRQALRLRLCRNGHSVAWHDGAAFVASTGTDAVIKVTPTGEERFWRASEAGLDTVHVNSLLWHDGDCYVSAFGPKAGSLWSSAAEGFMLNTRTGIPVVSSIYHPHSLVRSLDRFWFCESSKMTVRSDRGDRLSCTFGYVRGLAVTQKHIFVGSTVGRTRSVSTGVEIANAADPGRPSGRCGVAVYEPHHPYENVDFIDLTAWGDEVYDIVAV